MPTEKTPDETKIDEVLPEVADDVDETTTAREPSGDEGDEGGQGGGAELVPVRRTNDDIRAEIAARRKAKLKAEQDGDGEGESETRDDDAEPETPPRRAEDDRATPKPTAVDPELEISLVIDGQVVKKKISEVVRHAQRDLAADNRLEEAKRILREAESRTRRATDAPEHQPDHGDSREQSKRSGRDGTSPEHPPGDVDLEAELDDIAERIQTGDVNDGKAALKRVVELARGGNTSPMDETKIADTVRVTIESTKHQEEVQKAYEAFAKEYPDFVSDPDLVPAFMRRVEHALKQDLKAGGMTDEDIAAIKDTKQLGFTHRQLRAAGANLRPIAGLLTDVGKDMASKFGKPSATPSRTQDPSRAAPSAQPVARTIERRIEQKRAIQPQPRTAGARAPQSQAPARPRTTQEIVAQMRKARGYTV